MLQTDAHMHELVRLQHRNARGDVVEASAELSDFAEALDGIQATNAIALQRKPSACDTTTVAATRTHLKLNGS